MHGAPSHRGLESSLEASKAICPFLLWQWQPGSWSSHSPSSLEAAVEKVACIAWAFPESWPVPRNRYFLPGPGMRPTGSSASLARKVARSSVTAPVPEEAQVKPGPQARSLDPWAGVGAVGALMHGAASCLTPSQSVAIAQRPTLHRHGSRCHKQRHRAFMELKGK